MTSASKIVPAAAAMAFALAACAGQASTSPSPTPVADSSTGRADLPRTTPPGGADGLTAPAPDIGGSSGDDGGDGASDGAATTPPPIAWVKVSGATFQMGSPASEACRSSTKETQHAVTLTHDFEIAATEVTQKQFAAMMGYNPSKHTACGDDCPVDNVTWHEAAAYCNKLSAALQRSATACYSCTGGQGATQCTVVAAFSGTNTLYDCSGYRLPTDAEWELAYRAGTTTPYYNGNNDAALCSGADPKADAIGWYNKNAKSSTHPVGQKAANALGIYDMAGNAEEWVHDSYSADLGSAPATDPLGPPADGTGIIRGGSFAHPAMNMRAAYRQKQTRANAGTAIGFRCVRSL